MENYSDKELIRLIVIENKGKYRDHLYNRYKDKVYRRCYSYLRNESLAREFVQDIFVKVFNKLDGFTQSSSFSTWLYTITINYCIDYSRRKSKHSIIEYMTSDSLPDVIDDLIPEDEENDSLFERFQNTLLDLPENYRVIIELKYLQNKKIKEIQKTLNLSESNTKMRIKRAKEALLLKFNQKYGSESLKKK
ncbi:MAG: RNA polymerase sigma factor [Bacteroidales bacterium]|nr:RNA polymerase sigma factor [Bacteroidales bacterium]MCF8404677.1 RNA polymerase sigma factor [Bacteroidales bacterium]